MNRIYQGRVSKVLDDQSRELDLHVLWQHHELFQDAVNYWAFALAVMAEGMTRKTEDGKDELTPMAKFAEQLRGNQKQGPDHIEGRWEDFTHKGTKREGLRHSLSRTLKIPLEDATWEKCAALVFAAVLKKFPNRKDANGKDVLHGVISELFPDKSRGAPKNLANEDPSWLCWTDKREKDNTPAKVVYRKQRGIYDFVNALFEADDKNLKELADHSVEESYLSGVVASASGESEDEAGEQKPEAADENPAEVTGYFVGAPAIVELERCLDTAKRLMSKVESRPELTKAEREWELAKAAFQRDYMLLGGDLSKADEQFQLLATVIENKKREETESPNAFLFQDWKRSGPGKDNIRVELFILLHCSGGSEFAAMLLKARLKGLYIAHLHSSDKRRYIEFVDKFGLCSSSDEITEPGKESAAKVKKARKAAETQADATSKPSTELVDFIKMLRKEVGYVLPSFTAMRGFVTQDGLAATCQHGAMGWKKFDNSAYEEAIKSPHQIREKQKERENERKTLEALGKLYKGKGRLKGKSDDGEDEEHIPGGFTATGDPRFAAMERVRAALRVEDGVQEGDFYEYTISQAALRGYEELREDWNKKVETGENYSEPKADELKEVLRAHQREHRDDVGAVRLFEEFLKKDNWCVWQVASDEVEKNRAAKNYSDNFVRDYLHFIETVDERKRKERPIQYTPADASESRRLFDFKGGTEGGWFEHEANADGLSLTTQIAMKCCDEPHALYRPQVVHIHYTAPRLLRDEARVLSESENLTTANWAQPMMRALGVPDNDRHNFKTHAVSLMPDWKAGSRNEKPDRLLLNFVLTPKEDTFIAHLRKQMGREKWPWAMQFNWNGDGHDSTLRWPQEDWSKVAGKKDFPGQWFANPELKSFRFIAIDLGQKQAGAYALMEASCCFSNEEKKKSRFIGRTEHNGQRRDWYARVVTTGLLKLPGEDAEVFRPEFVNGKPVSNSEGFREELSGSAGRIATPEESKKAIDFLTELQQLDLLDEDIRSADALRKHLTFPLQNAKMLIALRRAQSFASRLHRWCWFLDPQDEKNRKDQASRRKTAIKEIAEADEHPWLDKEAHQLAKGIHANVTEALKNGSVLEVESDPRIVEPLKNRLSDLQNRLPGWLTMAANRVYSSRHGRFVWIRHPDKPDCHLLDLSLLSKEERERLTKDEKRLAGQRGLSMERIEQLEELRKRCQSLNQMLRRDIGSAPKASRDDSIPDPCPTILAKLDDIKEQRRNQTAHMILAEALGLKLAEKAKPKDDAERTMREAKDSHGEYVKIDDKGHPVETEKGNKWRGIVDFTVIEDLSRYRTTQGRAPRENSRLMKWCHRAIRDKLKDANGSGMCELFGIPLVETPAAYSSRFCSRTGVAGFRATELSQQSLSESKWKWKVRKPEDETNETPEQKKKREEKCKQWELVFEQVRKANESRDGKSKGQKFRTLLVPEAGGSIFVPMANLDATYKRPAKDAANPKQQRPVIQFCGVTLEENQMKQARLIHSDVNAAVNLALRTVADARVWSIHSRLRSEREFGSPPKPRTKKEKRKKQPAEPSEATPVESKPDRFWVSEKEKRKYPPPKEEQKKSDVPSDKIDREGIEIKLEDAKAELKASDSRHPNFFADFANLNGTHWGAATLHDSPPDCPKPKHLVSGKALWGYVKDQSWKRCEAINLARLEAWGIEPPKEWKR